VDARIKPRMTISSYAKLLAVVPGLDPGAHE